MAKDTGVTKMSDLKGKRIGYVKGNPSVNVKNEAYVAFAGLTEKDIQPVWFGSYNAMKTAIVNNQLDGMSSVTNSANMREIEASPRGLIWPPFPAADKEAWARLNKVMDFLEPRRETVGAAIPPDGVELIGTRYPMITTYASTSADEVYAFVKAVDEAMGSIAGVTGTSAGWAPKEVGAAARGRGVPRGHGSLHEGERLVDRGGGAMAASAPGSAKQGSRWLEAGTSGVQGRRQGRQDH